MLKKYVVLIGVMCFFVPMVLAEAAMDWRMSLAGSWRCQLDKDDSGYNKEALDGMINLPGTTDQAGFGQPGPERSGVLTRRHEYIGPVWYTRQITIPDHWVDHEIELVLERVLWQSQVLLDGESVGQVQDSLCTPHIHHLGLLEPGTHTLVIRVDNRMIHPVGDKNHAYGEQTQTRWNGIVGKIELSARPLARIDSVRIFADPDDSMVKFEVKSTGSVDAMKIRAVVTDPATGKEIAAKKTVKAGGTVNVEVVCNAEITAWSEFSPKLYEAKIELMEGRKVIDVYSSSFGFRKITRQDNKLLINNAPAFMRGNLDCVHFVKTGYPSTHKQDWIEIFKKYQAHNLNHARFHSWCPPKAAFEAADELGIYLQPEGPFWIDGWMLGNISSPDYEGPVKGLGYGDRTLDEFAQAEFRRIVDTYGNHPSFVFFCFGNELGASNFDVLDTWASQLKSYDNRRLYSVSAARTITSNCDYSVTHHIGGIGSMRGTMQFGTNWNYQENYEKTPVPTIAHEIGQWPVYPDWSICEKFDGVLHNTRLEKMRQEAKEKGVYGDQAEFTRASGALNALLYKDEIESFLRTPSCRGFQLLSMQDFQGQGEAYVGWLDCFWDAKGTTNTAAFRGYCDSVVALAELPSYVFVDSDKLSCDLLVRNDGPTVLKNVKLTASLTDKAGNVITESSFAVSAQRGAVVKAGEFTTALTADTARRLNLVLAIDGKKDRNSYPLWVYPKSLPEIDSKQIVITDVLDDVTVNALNEGKSVLLNASQLGTSDTVNNARWKPLTWSAVWFSGQYRTLGLVVRDEHPAFDEFPTEFFNNWQWYRICDQARGFDLTGIVPAGYKPIAQPVTDFHINNKLGTLFEIKTGKGKLLVSGYDLDKDLPEMRQLKYSLLKYMQTDAFNPTEHLATEVLQKLLIATPSAPVSAPGGFENALFYVKAGGKKQTPGHEVWNPGLDDVLVAGPIRYTVKAEGVWKDDVGTCWHGKNIQIEMTVPIGITADLYVHIDDWNHAGRRGKIVFEGREFTVGKHDGKGKWLKFYVMREDAQDGKLVIDADCTEGPNLMISAIALIPRD